MAVYLVKYQLNKPGKNYDELYAALKQYDYIRDPSLHSAWFVSSNSSAHDVSNYIRPHMDQNDDVFVTRLRSGEYAGWIHKDIWPWITARL